MTGKPITGKSFGGCVRYLVNREEAAIIDADGVRIQSARSITLDFNMQRKLNPGLGQAVGHSVLSWSARDLGKLTDELMVQVRQRPEIPVPAAHPTADHPAFGHAVQPGSGGFQAYGSPNGGQGISHPACGSRCPHGG